MRTDQIKILLLVSMGLTIVSAVITYFTVKESRKRVDWVLHSYQVLAVGSNLLTRVSRAESGVRAYMLTNDSIFLESYITARASWQPLVEELKTLSLDDSFESKTVSDKISVYVKYKIEQLAIVARISRTHGPDSAVAYSYQRKSELAYSNLQEYMDDFNNHENELLQSRLSSVSQILDIQTYIRYTSLGLIAITLLFAYIIITEKQKENTELITALNDSNAALEQKIKARTLELDLKNKAMEELNQKLVLLNEEKNHFLGIAAHDLKSPLHSIVGLINLLTRDNSLSPSQKEYIGFIERSCISMQRLITNLLDINKIEEGVTLLHYESIKVSDIVKAQQNLFFEEALSKNIALVFEDTTNGESIYTDEDAINRILENLISNALKFSQKNKRVTVEITLDEEVIQFTVIDQGPGISKEDFPKLFGRFQKLGARPTNGESSSGLGLSIVKDLVELMNGKITVETNSKGSRFIVALPEKA